MVTTQGTIAFPADITSSYPFTVAPGPVIATVRFAAGDELSLALSCVGAALHQRSAEGLIELHLSAGAGGCDAVITGRSTSTARVPYSLSLSYRTPAGAS